MDTQLVTLGDHPFIVFGCFLFAVLFAALVQYFDGVYDRHQKLKNGIVEFDFSRSRRLR